MYCRTKNCYFIYRVSNNILNACSCNNAPYEVIVLQFYIFLALVTVGSIQGPLEAMGSFVKLCGPATKHVKLNLIRA